MLPSILLLLLFFAAQLLALVLTIIFFMPEISVAPLDPAVLMNLPPVGFGVSLFFAELLLSPIGISFVSKVAPPKYAGLMMGLWFGATAIGNQLVMVPGIMWGQNFNLVTIWGVLAGICLVSALFIFSIIKKLNKVS